MRMNMSSTSDKVLFHLKTRGAATAQEVGGAFDMTPMGAYKVLQSLVDQGLAQFEDVAAGRGRPKRSYMLTEAGHGRFPDRHSDLSVELIANVRKVFGQEGLDRLIGERETQQVQRYRDAGQGSLEARVMRLAELRARDGYMARVERMDDGALLLIEDHCPICAAAESCQGFCRSELRIFEMILGPDAEITREDHVLAGGRRCTYRIRELAAA